MKISLILATLGRDVELLDFLKSLIFQTYQNFELIVIDQNQDGKIDDIMQRFTGCMDIKHIKVNFIGNARARDYGIGMAQGRIVAFPDDDCVYDKRVLEAVVSEFNRRKQLAILVAGSYDFSATRFSVGVNSRRACYFSRLNMMGVEFTQFFALDRVDRQQFYLDHDFGIGSKYDGAEGFELLYRLLRAGNKAFYTPRIKIYHANKAPYSLNGGRMLNHSTGIGAYIRKFANQHDLFVTYYILQKMLLAPVFKMVMALLTLNFGKLTYAYYNLLAIWCGFLAYGRPEKLSVGN